MSTTIHLPFLKMSVHEHRFFSSIYFSSILFFFVVSAYVLFVLNFQLPEIRVLHNDARLPPSNDSVRRFVHIICMIWVIGFLSMSGVFLYLESKFFLNKKKSGLIFMLLFAVALGAALTKPIGSSDFYQYLAYGWILVEHQVNPYILAPRLFFNDPIVSSLVQFWWDVPCNYGPIALLTFAMPSFFGAKSVVVMSVFLKCIWLVCYMMFVAVFYMVLIKLRKPYPMSMVSLLFLNPFTLWFWLIDGHMDLLPLMFLFAAMICLATRKWILAGVFSAIVCASKIIFVIIMPFLILFIIKESVISKSVKVNLFKYLASTIFTVAILYIPFKGAEVFNVFSGFLSLPMRRLPGFLSPGPRLFYDFLGILRVVENKYLFDVASLLGMALFCGIYIYFLVRSIKDEINIERLLMTCGIVMFGFACSVSYSQPWYVMWFYPIIFITLINIRALVLVTVIFCLFSVAGLFSHPVDAQKLVAQVFSLGAAFIILIKSPIFIYRR